jgi:hypothetical protein
MIIKYFLSKKKLFFYFLRFFSSKNEREVHLSLTDVTSDRFKGVIFKVKKLHSYLKTIRVTGLGEF